MSCFPGNHCVFKLRTVWSMNETPIESGADIRYLVEKSSRLEYMDPSYRISKLLGQQDGSPVYLKHPYPYQLISRISWISVGHIHCLPPHINRRFYPLRTILANTIGASILSQEFSDSL